MRTTAILATLILLGGGCGDAPEDASRLPLFIDVGGPKLSHPELVIVSYADDFERSGLDKYIRWMVTSSWLKSVGTEYGIGQAEVLATVQNPTSPAEIDDTEIVDQLFAGLANASLPGPTADTLYVVLIPALTVVTVGTARSCEHFTGYHDSARRNGVEIAYAVIANCATTLRAIVLSRELINAATDPFPRSNPGWQLRDPATPWRAMGVEVADLCMRGDESGTSTGDVFPAQRSWSNANAAAELDPCVPHVYGGAYFNTAIDTKALLRIQPGSHQTVHVEGFATYVKSWLLRAQPAVKDSAVLTLGAGELTPGTSTTLDIALPSSTPVETVVYLYAIAERGSGGTYEYQYLPVPVIAGDPCASFTDCVSCTSREGCGYCASSGRCESQGASGSAESSCSGKSFATWPASCPRFCERSRAGCGQCTSQPGCGWCADGSACMEASHDYSHPENATCAYADWSFTSSYCPRAGT